MRLVGTTKPTIESIRERTHWNSNSLSPMDPVTLGLCSQIDLDMEVERAAKAGGGVVPQQTGGATLLPASQTTAAPAPAPISAAKKEELDAEAVFAKLKSLKGPEDEKSED